MKDVEAPTADLPDRGLLPRPEAAIGWWFVHGQALVAPDDVPVHFMVAFFEVRGPAARTAPAFMLLAHVMAGDGRVLYRRSLISPQIADIHADVAAAMVAQRFPAGVSRFVLGRHMAQVRRQANALGVAVAETAPNVAPDRFALEWDGFVFRSLGAGCQLRLADRDREVLDLRLEPDSVWLNDIGLALDPSLAPPYHYLSCPRLRLSGRVDGREAGGRAWIDRQWGEFDNWLVTAKPASRLMGWDWAGLWLDNGCDVLAVRSFSLGSGREDSGYAVLFDASGPRRLAGRLEPLPGGQWTSPASGISYPLAQRLILPDRDADLHLLPLAPDQEIPVFGAPAIWEGAVRVEGRFDGQPVRGTGRLELFGYGYADTLARFTLRQVGQGLRHLLAPGQG